jgi:Zn ribbon nucleic-acid-binding protein
METPDEIGFAFRIGLIIGGLVVVLVACFFYSMIIRSTQLYTTQFRDGFLLIRWYTNEIDSVETVQCGDRSLQLTLRRVNDKVTLSIKENPGKAHNFHLILI